ncbi:CoA-disulfide reductase [Rathayibacter rathayi]|uniref:CoA-disulfide reductase n=1 Tax=Rathayibacter rathayi TaxID=33887 RepID=A0ABD6WC98_RATRA|nr:FAD-dependent oxidoreductase [Rathayibacter rathayi]PPF16226.1 CoA-disulfide reductase [Rathayibacter rathayi]PPF83405.1 CoA-disulfide reductase [Rathayibacter rathayi]PPG16328.1 CoA-disulfide reductase [Rathayibacter rathayi]PPG47225.1 CoA-disulfide reductase [Rathayibacter rathayi]PPH39353.1 CoA-disulfide reductase [Rathayibacter rathayi]
MRTVIIGGVAGGMSAATRLRRLAEEREIVVLERGAYVSFANCGLPYYVGGVIAERSALLLQTPESLAARFRLDVRVRHEAIAIDAVTRTVTVRDLARGRRFEIEYDSLVLAAGAGTGDDVDSGSIPTFTLRSIEDVDRITETVSTIREPSAIVVGAGFIGLEAVENLVARGVAVTLLQRGPQVLSPLDPEMAAPVQQALVDAGVDVRTSTTLTALSGRVAQLSDGTTVEADFIIRAAGVRPETGLARAAGIAIGPTGGIAVDARQRTSAASIWAVGDGVEKIDYLDVEPTLVTMAGLANRHGRAAADDIAGAATTDAAPALGTSIVGVLGLTIGLVGANEKRLLAAGRAHRILHTHPFSHAGYYPGAEQMAMKLLVDPLTDAILGAQIVGGDGVDKRLDVIAVAMTAGLTASALSRLELAYAPQYGSAKDPVNLLGYVAENTATGATRTLQWHELDAALEEGAVLIDVRSTAEHAASAIPGALSLPLEQLRERHHELPTGRVIVHCQVGQRGHTAARLLTQLGHDVRNLDGGYLTWTAGTRRTTIGSAAAAA